MTTAYPLSWPPGWPRTPAADQIDGRLRFKRPERGAWTFSAARDALYEELTRLGSPPWNTILSTNFQINQRGEPTKAFGRPSDEGIAVYFRIDGKSLVMACDRFDRAEENMRSLTLAIQAMRQLERHGGGHMMTRAFTGFSALPAPSGRHWTEVLGLPIGAPRTREAILEAHRRLARIRHPDAGGSDELMAELNAARDQALKEIAP